MPGYFSAANDIDEVLDALRKDYSIADLPVLLMSFKAQEKDLVEGFARGASDHIIKPYSFAEVTARINHHVMFLSHHARVPDVTTR